MNQRFYYRVNLIELIKRVLDTQLKITKNAE